MNPQEATYLRVVKRILEEGKTRGDRTGVGTKSVFGEHMTFDISETVPLLTTKRVAWKSIIHELLWFCRGSTDVSELQALGVRIWDGNSTREFLDGRKLAYEEGDIGPGYGFQWRHSGAEYVSCKHDYTGQGFDQLAAIERGLKEDPYSRRHYMSAWNPSALEAMALPPCHVSVQFYVEDEEGEEGEEGSGKKRLNALMVQRSADFYLGVPYNIFSYTCLTYLLAAKCGMKPGKLHITTGDTHLYLNHMDAVLEQLERVPKAAPRLVVNPGVASKDWSEITIADFTLHGYEPHPAIRAPMAV